MSTQAQRATRPRTPLTRERILDAASRLADRAGIAPLTMRKLGEALGVEAMSLYHHVRDKEDLLDGMVDLVFGEIALPADGVDWHTAMRRRAVSARDVLLRHPWAIGLMEARSRPGPATLRHHDAVLGLLRRAGFSVALAAHAYSVLDSYSYGFTQTELTLPFRDADGAAAVAGTIFQAGRAAAYPYLAEMAVAHALQPGYRYGDEFAFGLDLILDGIERVKNAV